MTAYSNAHYLQKSINIFNKISDINLNIICTGTMRKHI